MRNVQRGFSSIEALLICVAVGIVGFTGIYVWQSKDNANSTYSSVDKVAGSTATPLKKKSLSQQTYSNGIPVPEDSVNRARAAGYYCPSWDAKPGKVAPYYCAMLDK